MPDLNVDDVLLLIHGEVTTAINSAMMDGNSPGIEISNIRVRMGQNKTHDQTSDDDSNISLDVDRFPPAKQGWLIDVTYNAKDKIKSTTEFINTEQLSPTLMQSYFSHASVSKISGVGHYYTSQLTELGIETIAQLANFKPKEDTHSKVDITTSQLRAFQSLANLCLSIPSTSIPQDLSDIQFEDLVEIMWQDTITKRYPTIPDTTIANLKVWLQQLEMCLDNSFFNQLTFRKIVSSTLA